MTRTLGPEPGAITEFRELLHGTPHDSLANLCIKMAGVTEALPSVGLENTVPFAHAYQAVTQQADRALQADAFTDAPTTERLACNFAGWYFNALASHVTGSEDAVPGSWQQLFHANPVQPAWLLLALGVNAHIGYDLPLALQATPMPPDFRDNYLSLNKAIRRIASELAPALLPTVPQAPRKGIAAVTANIIGHWRRQAWSDFKRLEAGKTSLSELESDAAQRGRRLQTMGRALGAIGLTGIKG